MSQAVDPRSGLPSPIVVPSAESSEAPQSADLKSAVEYARRVYDSVLGWYLSADTKAQVILALDGAFLAFVSTVIFAKPEDVKQLAAHLPTSSRVLLAAMFSTLTISIVCAITCLWSRTYSRRTLLAEMDANRRRHNMQLGQPPESMWFFQFIATMKREEFGRTLASVTPAFEVEAMTSQIHILSGYVRRKHRATNLGFICAAATFLLFLAAGGSYVLQVR